MAKILDAVELFYKTGSSFRLLRLCAEAGVDPAEAVNTATALFGRPCFGWGLAPMDYRRFRLAMERR